MHVAASYTLDRDYFEAYYAGWLACRSRWRRYAIPLAMILVAATAAAYYLTSTYRLGALAFFVLAVVFLIDVGTYRFRWLGQRLRSSALGKTAAFVFTDDHVEITSPHSRGTIDYQAFDDVVPTPEGVFLVPGSGVSLFVPRGALASEDEYRAVSDRLTQCATAAVPGQA
jgi:uncharacterized protein (DUF58 family)